VRIRFLGIGLGPTRASPISDSGKDSSQKPRSRAGTSGIPFLLPPQLLNSSPKAFQGMILGIMEGLS
jgi:hypothetical protein